MLGNLKDKVKDLSSEVQSTVAEKELDEETLDPILEEFRLKLLQSNVSLDAAEQIQEDVKQELLGEDIRRGRTEEAVKEALRNALLDVMDDSFSLEKELKKCDEPPVILLIGFNGSGKTTTAAKISRWMQDQGRDTVLGAGDTFRAASIEQLEEHGRKLGVKVVSHKYESDPAAVAYDAIEHAEKEEKVAIIDTAGRSHSNDNLMKELDKMVRVNEPDISFLVVDALAGNDVVEQAEAYKGMFDAFILTKMDVDENGGAAISISEESGKPVAFLGTGQEYEDLEKFDANEFVDEILE